MSRISKTKKRRILVVIGCIIVIGAAFAGSLYICTNQLQAKYDTQIESLSETITSNQRFVYRALVDIPAGTEINSSNTEYVTVFSDMDEYVYMTDEDLGKIAVADIYAGQNICANMVGDDLAFSLRECEYALLTLNNNLSANDFVDVRIMYPNGENYVVLSKKNIQSIDMESNAVMFWLTEDEIMDMSSAIVDTYLHSGTILYTTKYIQDSQEELERSYQPSGDCMIAIANDPNIIDEAMDAVTERMSATLRSSLETRLDLYENADGSGTSSGTTTDLSNSIRVGNYTGEDIETNDGTSDDSDAESDSDDLTTDDFTFGNDQDSVETADETDSQTTNE
jgi:hypothetical protein